jgi:hypothetical protein
MDIQRKSLKIPKDTDMSNEDVKIISDSESEISKSETDHYEKLNRSRTPTSHHPETSDTELIERETAPPEKRHTPTTKITQKKRDTEIPRYTGIAPIRPIPQRQSQVTSVEKDTKTALSLRLDLNLDIEIELKARIKGDLTLSLLLVVTSTFLMCLIANKLYRT